MKRMTQSGFAKNSKEMEKEIKAENVLFQVSYALIVVVSVLILSMAFAGIVSAENEVIEATVLPLTSEEKGSDSELREEGKSRFAEEGLWVDTGEVIVPGTSKSAEDIAEYYKPRLYLNSLSDQCPDEVYYRVVKGIDIWAESYAYLIQYFAYWDNQNTIPPFSHEYDYEPIFIWVENIGDRPYRVAYDHCDISDITKHHHEIHRTHSYIYPGEDVWYPILSFTNDKAYYPYGKTLYTNLYLGELHLLNLDNSLKDNWFVNQNMYQVKLAIANLWHTFDTDITGLTCCDDYSLSPLTDDELIRAYCLERGKEAFKYDISDPFKGVFWEDHYHRDHEFPTISGNIKSAVVNNEILTVKVSMLYDNTGAGGHPDQHLTGLWWDRFSAKISTDTGYEIMGNPDKDEFDEPSPGEYILKYDVSGIDINSVLHLKVVDNVKVGICDDLIKHITFVSAEVYVPDDYPTIQAAVDNATAGDTIIVRDGTYTENVRVNKQLTIRSENGPANCIVDAGGNGSAITLSADGITLEGFSVINSGSSSLDAGIKVISSSNKITGNTISSNNWYGISLIYSNNNTISGNNVSDNKGIGISLIYSNNNTISGNNVSDNKGIGINLVDSSNDIISGNTLVNDGLHVYESYQNSVEDNSVNGKPLVYFEDVSDCKVEDAGQVILINCRNITVENLDLSNTDIGIELFGTVDSIIADNTVSNNLNGISLDSSHNNIISGNTVSNNLNGISLDSSHNNTISGNTVSSNNGCGIYLGYSQRNTISGNNVSSNNGWGIKLGSSQRNTISGNDIINNDYGIGLRFSSNKIYLNNFMNNTDNVYSYLYSTSIWNSPEKITYTYNDNTYTNYLGNYWYDYIGSDANNDGIGDTPYSINSDNNDNFPLMARFENYVGEDTTPPTVTSVSPQNGAIDVTVDTVVTATFSEAMDSSTITTDSFTFAGTPRRGWQEIPPIPPTESMVSGTVTYDSDTFTATFTPDANIEYNHEYTATLSTDITDEAGNPLTEAYTWSFTTEPVPAQKTIYVDDDFIDDPANHKWNTIQEGVDDANHGDKIIVYPGTYTENVDVDKSVTIESEDGADSTIVQAENPYDPVFEVIANHVNIRGFRVKGIALPFGKALEFIFTMWATVVSLITMS